MPVFKKGDPVTFRKEPAVIREVQRNGNLIVEWTEKKAGSGDPGYFENVDPNEVTPREVASPAIDDEDDELKRLEDEGGRGTTEEL